MESVYIAAKNYINRKFKITYQFKRNQKCEIQFFIKKIQKAIAR